MLSQNSSNLTITSFFLERGIDYIFTVSYINFVGENLSATHEVHINCSVNIDCAHILATKCVSGFCEYQSTLVIIGPINISGNEDFNLTAEIDQEEQEHFSNLSFVWSVKASINGQKPLSELHDFLSTQTNQTINIPASLIEPDVEYNFTVSYINPAGLNISASHDITPICGRGIFQKPGFGCVGNCSGACNQCLNETVCLECASFAELGPNNKTCLMNSTVNITGPSITSNNSALILDAMINPNEAAYLPISYVWTVTSNSIDTSLKSSLDSYLSSQNSSSLTITLDYLQRSFNYTFMVSYINFVGENISAIHQVYVPCSVNTDCGHIPAANCSASRICQIQSTLKIDGPVNITGDKDFNLTDSVLIVHSTFKKYLFFQV